MDCTSLWEKIAVLRSASAGLRGQISVASFSSVSSVTRSLLTAALRALAKCIAATVRAVSMAAIGLELSKSLAVVSSSLTQTFSARV